MKSEPVNFEDKLKDSKSTKKIIDYLRRESSNKFTEFRLVVQEDGSAYMHVMNRDSETIDFNINYNPLTLNKE